MIGIICGENGKGKSKELLAKCHEAVENVDGSVIFIDKGTKHMYDLDSKVRLINMSEYPVENTNAFLGFLSGVISQNNDIEEIFLDNYLKIATIDTNNGLIESLQELDKISDCFDVKFTLSISKGKDDIPNEVQDKIVVSL